MADDNLVKFVLRINPKLHKKIKAEAKREFTSMNRLIERTLEGRYKDMSDSQKLSRILKLLEE